MAQVQVEGCSGVDAGQTQENPYSNLISVSDNSAQVLQALYEKHRVTRNAQQKAKILSPEFTGWTLDPFLVKLSGPHREPGYTDPRVNLTFWARPPSWIREIVRQLQEQLTKVAPTLWLMPLENLHMTTLEVMTGSTEAQVQRMLDQIGTQAIRTIAEWTSIHRARLVKPLICYDAAALALTFVPAAGEPDTAGHARNLEADEYTYHHLRRDVFAMTRATAVDITPRYTVPSAHLTIARFNNQNGFQKNLTNSAVEVDREAVATLIRTIEELNNWLELETWPAPGKVQKLRGNWTVGHEKTLECRKGRSWYGGGESVYVGAGF
ncbi:MAG: hypothetical protein Q9162_004529 [Coniocarpon cinnabarinum]